MKCPKCGARMWQHPNNKYLISCSECNTEMRNPRFVEQTSFEKGKLTLWKV